MNTDSHPTPLAEALAAIEAEDFETARQIFENLLLDTPHLTEAHVGLGDAGFGLGDYELADEAYRKALDIDPRNSDALFGLAATLRVTEVYDEAVSLYERGFDVEPDRTEAYWELAYSREMDGDQAGAADAYQSCLRHHPDHGMAAHLYAAMTGAKTPRAPENYVRDLFDDYAETFDTDLVEDLNYVVPRLIQELLDSRAGELLPSNSSKFKKVLDLGCGTGLVAEAIRSLSSHITGVDLSPKMLEAAANSGRIDESITSDMVRFLADTADRGKTFDLIVCGDALVYLGALEDLIGNAAACLASNGVFCFTAEDLSVANYTLMPTGRYAHNATYIGALLKKSGLSIEAALDIVPRKDSSEDIPGRLYLARKV